MNRQEAIVAIVCVWTQRDDEFCVGSEERRKSEAELEEALRALGVMREELYGMA